MHLSGKIEITLIIIFLIIGFIFPVGRGGAPALNWIVMISVAALFYIVYVVLMRINRK